MSEINSKNNTPTSNMDRDVIKVSTKRRGRSYSSKMKFKKVLVLSFL